MNTKHLQTSRFRTCLFFVILLIHWALGAAFAQSLPIYDQAGNPLPDSLLLPVNTQMVLSVSPHVNPNASIQWMLNGRPIPGQNNPQMSSQMSGTYTCTVTTPGGGRNGSTMNAGPVCVHYATTVRCGDLNNDGHVNMVDMFPLSVAFGTKGVERPTPVLNPADDTDYPAFDWTVNRELAAVLPPQLPNPKHFDSNGDGLLLDNDLQCVAAQYEPLYQSASLLAESYSGTGSGRGDLIKLRAEIPANGVSVLGDGRRVELRFNIVLDELPGRDPFVKMKGLIFTDAVTETPNYTIDGMRLDFTDSDLFDQRSDALALGKPFAGLNVRTAPGSCVPGNVFLTEIGLFNKYESRIMYPGDAPISCIVTIDDLFRVHNPNNLGLDSVPVVIQTFNALNYIEKNGQMAAVGSECRLDTFWLDIDSLYQVALAGGSQKYNPADPSTVTGSVKNPIHSAVIAPQPVPAGAHTRLRLQCNQPGSIAIEIMDLQGRTHWTQSTEVIPGAQWIELDHPTLAPGAYVVKLQRNGEILRKKMVVAH